MGPVSLAKTALNNNEKLDWAKRATAIRKRISEKVADLREQHADVDPADDDDVADSKYKLKKGRGVPGTMTAGEYAELERQAIGCARLHKKRKLAELGIGERKQIVAEYNEQNIMQMDIAKRHQVSSQLVSKLVTQARKDPDWADELELREVKRRRAENMIAIGAKSLQRENTPLTSVKLIKDFVWDYGF